MTEQKETYEAGPPMSPVMIAGVAAEIRGILDGMTPDNYRDRLTEVIRVATWARWGAQTTNPLEEILADAIDKLCAQERSIFDPKQDEEEGDGSDL